MKTAVLLPAAILSVLGAFAQRCYLETIEIAGNAATMPIVAELRDLVARETPAEIAVVSLTPEQAGRSVAAGSTDAAVFALPTAARCVPAAAKCIGAGGYVFVVHPHRTVADLSSQTVRDLFAGRIHDWSQLGGPAAPIRLLLADSLARERCQQHWQLTETPAVQIVGSDHRCERMVAGDPFAIGCVSAVAALRAIADGAPLAMLTIDGIAADESSLRSGSYPLAEFLWLLQPQPGDARDQVLRRDLEGTDGCAVLLRHGYLPLLRP